MNKYKVALIGAGQLGSRHLQGLSRSSIKLSIEVVEPIEQCRVVAKNRYDEMQSADKIEFFGHIGQLSDHLDLVIIATTADVRAEVVQQLLEEKKVRNLVLEKVLFQKLEDYEIIDKLLRQKAVSAWVNHPRRCFPFYQELKCKLKDAESTDVNVMGGAWGLTCNGLHMLDLFCYLTGQEVITLYPQLLDNEIKESKRANFKEVTGVLIGESAGNKISIHCQEKYSPLHISISSARLAIKIDEAAGEYQIATAAENWKWYSKTQKIAYFQSELSHLFVEEILGDKGCTLPTYSEARKLHEVFIRLLSCHINTNLETSTGLCPIT